VSAMCQSITDLLRRLVHRPMVDQIQETGPGIERLLTYNVCRHSARSASSGEIELARNAGISEATSADNPSVTTATNITMGLCGFMP
jgi:hypothetical protein